MRVCGVELAASEARLVLHEGEKTQFSLISVKPSKLVLMDDESAEEVQAFRNTIYAFFRENNVDKVAIKKRNKAGEYAGSSISFKLEGIVQLFEDCDIQLISPQSIAAAKREYSFSNPNKLYKYQDSAFETAFTALT